VTLRYDDQNRPVGLDWSVCNDGSSQPWVWSDWSPANPKKKRRAPIKNPGVGRGGLTRISPHVERQVIERYTSTVESPKETGKHFGISRQAVYKILRRNDIPTRTKSEAMTLVRQTIKW
jgi:hypothetical protein